MLTHRALHSLLRPRSIAVVGASPRRRMARTVLANLRRFGYRGTVWAVHPSGQPVEGFPCFRSIGELPAVPDCAVIALSPENTLIAFRELVERGVKAAVILGSGFGEAGPDGQRIQAELVSLAEEHGVAVCGPNCLGLIVPDEGVTLTGYHLPEDLAPGAVAGVVQSGSVFWSLAHNTRGIRFRYLVSSGNEAVLDAAEYLAAALEDPEVKLLVAFLETVRDGPRFLEVVEVAHRRGVPVVVLKVGRSEAGRAAVLAHTGALAGSHEVVAGVLNQYGVIRVDTLDELYDVAEFLLAGRLPETNRVGAVTDSGGEKTLILDWGERVGVAFPPLDVRTAERLRGVLAPYVPISNPLDAWGAGNFEEVYPVALRALADDPAVDTVVLGTDMVRETEEAQLYAQAMLELSRYTAKPIAVVTNQANGLDNDAVSMLRSAGIPVLQGTEYGYRAIARAAWYRHWRERPRPQPQRPRELDELRAALSHALRSSPILGEYEAKRLFALIGLRHPRERLVQRLEEALAAAEELGYPVVLKAVGPHLLHKTERGAVRLGIGGPRELERAWLEMSERIAEFQPGGVTGFLVQEQVPPGLEVILGCHYDPTFGMVVSVGLGGVLVELLRDVVYRRAPITAEEAEEMLSELRGAALLAGYRGKAPRDRAALVDALVQFSWFAQAGEGLIEVAEANPLIVGEDGAGAWVVDGLVVARHHG